MHPRIVGVAPPRPETARPAKVIQLETRRKARLEAVQLAQSRPRPAA
jgi:hypothetical protein